MTIAAVALSFVTLSLDEILDWDAERKGWFRNVGSAEGARTVLGTIAGSMITVASLTFSITIASLSLTSSQFGPRIVRNFVRDTGNQIVLGTFIATFLYCLLILRTVRGGETDSFVPSISLTVGVVLAIASLAVLIYFISHVVMSIQAAHIIGSIGRDLDATIERLFPERIDEENEADHDEDEEVEFQGEAYRVLATRSGYIQSIDYEHLLATAKDASVVVWIPNHPGQFVARGQTIAEVYGVAQNDKEKLDESVLGAFLLGNDRSSRRDIEFYIDQLVEIAVRALSPGINDPFTAIQCIDRLGASLRLLAERTLPSGNHRDEEGEIRVVAKAQTMEGALDAAINPIRQYGGANPPVMMRLLETLAVLAEFAPSEAERKALLMHARMIENSSAEHLKERVDLDALEERVSSVIEILESNGSAERRR